MSLEKYDYEKLLDDIKLISRCGNLLYIEKEEISIKERKIYQLFENLITRLYRDIQEIKNAVSQNGKGYGGYLNDEIKEEIYGE